MYLDVLNPTLLNLSASLVPETTLPILFFIQQIYMESGKCISGKF